MSRATALPLPLPLRPVRYALLGIGKLPAGLLAAVARWSPVNAEGEHVSPELSVLGLLTARVPGTDMGGRTPERARAGLRLSSALIAEKPIPLAVEEDLEFDGPAGRRRRGGRVALRGDECGALGSTH
ncbi:MAG: hypothetical protein QM673_15755 [Gordonia sp. (in: high G+C Gram-positive bacteria)]